MVSNNQSIGIVLGGHLGDGVLYSSVLKPIRDRFPAANITLIASPPAKELFGDSPYIDRVVGAYELLLGPWKWLKIPKKQFFAWRTKRLWVPSLVVDTLIFPFRFVSLLEVALLEVIKRREVIGCIGGFYLNIDGGFWQDHVTHPVQVPQNYLSRHVSEHIADFLRQLGCVNTEPSQLRVEINIKEKDNLSASSLVAPFGGRPYGMIFPGAAYHREIKLWPMNRYGEVVRLLGESGPRCWVVCGTTDEYKYCRDVVQSMLRVCPGVQTIISCQKPLHQIAAALKGARIAVGTDNGGMHMAVAVGTPTISIVSGAANKSYFPWGDAEIHRAEMYPMDCWGCMYNCIQPSVMCIENITPQAVAEGCRSVLDVHRDRISAAAKGLRR